MPSDIDGFLINEAPGEVWDGYDDFIDAIQDDNAEDDLICSVS